MLLLIIGVCSMLEFVVVDDNLFFQLEIKKMIQNCMKRKNVSYQIFVYDDYTKGAYELTSKNKRNMRIYLLDTETPSKKIQDYVQKIRKYDFSSYMIGLGGEENLFLALRNMFTDYINYHQPQWKRKLKESIEFLLEYEVKREILRFIENDVQYTIHIDDIHFLERYKRKKTIIQTESCSYLISYTLEELKYKLPSYFVYKNPACIYNYNHLVISSASNVNDERTRNHQPQKGKRYSKKDRQKALYMYYSGISEEQIIRKFGMHINTLRIWIAKDKTYKYQKSEFENLNLQNQITTLHSKNMKLKMENQNLKREKIKADATCERFRKAVHILSESGDET